MFDTYELAVLAGLNFSSVFAALLVLKARDARKKRKMTKFLMEEIGDKLAIEQSFSEIVRKNFMNERGNDDEGR